MKATTDAETKAVTAFLQTIVETHERLHELARQLRSCSEVKAVKVYPFAPGDITQHHWDEEQKKKPSVQILASLLNSMTEQY